MNRSEARTAVMFALTTGKSLSLRLGPTSTIDIEGDKINTSIRNVKVWVDGCPLFSARVKTADRESFAGWVLSHFTETDR